jgi:hypothetical protein
VNLGVHFWTKWSLYRAQTHGRSWEGTVKETHGKEWVPLCRWSTRVWQSNTDTRQSVITANSVPCTPRHTADGVPTTCPSWRGSNLCRVHVTWAHGRWSLPSLSLPWQVCRVPVHGRWSAVSKRWSAVSLAHTAEAWIPVVQRCYTQVHILPMVVGMSSLSFFDLLNNLPRRVDVCLFCRSLLCLSLYFPLCFSRHWYVVLLAACFKWISPLLLGSACSLATPEYIYTFPLISFTNLFLSLLII